MLVRNRIAAVGAAGALALGSALVASAPAGAATLDTKYTCATSFGPQTFATKVTLDLPASVLTGSAVPARPVALAVTIPASLVSGLKFLGVTHLEGTAANASAKVGTQSVPLQNIVIPKTELGAGDTVLTGTGTAAAFTAGDRGLTDVNVPTSFTFTAKDQNGGTLVDNAPCSITAGSPTKVGTVDVTGFASTTAVKVKNKPITTAKKAKLAVTVASSGQTPTGKVTAKLGKKVLKTGTLTNGKVTLKLPKLKAGKRKIVVRYAGDNKVEPSKKRIIINVKA